jgi:hypothetical protein
MAAALVRPGQAEDVLGEVVEDHLRAAPSLLAVR